MTILTCGKESANIHGEGEQELKGQGVLPFVGLFFFFFILILVIFLFFIVVVVFVPLLLPLNLALAVQREETCGCSQAAQRWRRCRARE